MKLYRVSIEVCQEVGTDGSIAWDQVANPEMFGSEYDIEGLSTFRVAIKANDVEKIESCDEVINDRLNAEEAKEEGNG